jgi:hypothetical protein
MTFGNLSKTDVYSILKTAGRFFAKCIVATVSAATILSLLIGIYGQEETFNKIKSILENIFNSRTFLQVSFIVVGGIVFLASIIFIKFSIDIKQKLGNEFDNNNKILKNIQDLLGNKFNLGIINIGLRGELSFNPDAYKTIFQCASDELIISGHSLNKTVNKKNDDVRDAFMNTIIRLVEKNTPVDRNGAVRILLSKINGSEDLEKKRKTFDIFIKEVYDILKAKGIPDECIARNLLIKETNFLPYYIVRSGNRLHIGHYTFSEYLETKKKICYVFEVNPNLGYGEYYYNDFISYFNNEEETDFITEYRNMFKGKHAE